MEKIRSRAFGRGQAALILIFMAFWPAMPAIAQSDNYDAGKTPAQLFTSNCSICHKSPAGLAKDLGPMGLEGFLRDHYSASAESAAVIARYLRTVDAAQPPSQPSVKRRKADSEEKDSNKTKRDSGGKSSPADKPADAKGRAGPKVDTKSADKPAEPKSESKKPESKKPEAKKPDPTPADAKASEPAGSDAKAPDKKPDDAPAAKPADKPN